MNLNAFVKSLFFLFIIIFSVFTKIKTTSEIIRTSFISVSPNLVGNKSNYLIMAIISFSVVQDNTISLILPSQLKVDSSILSCDLKSNNSYYVISVKSCTYTNISNIEKINIVLNTNLDLINSNLQINVSSGIINPPSIYTDAVILNIYDNSNNIVGTNNLTFTYSPGIIYDPTISSNSNTAGELATLTFSFTPKNEILKGGYIMVRFPYFNQNSGASSDAYISLLNSATPPALSNQKIIDPNSSLSIDSADVKVFVKIINIFPNNPSDKTSNISFSLSNILNPPSLDNSNYKIDETADFGFSVTTPAPLSYFEITYDTKTINQNSSVNFNFIHSYFLPNNVQIEIIFPNSYPVSYSTSFINVKGIFNMVPEIKYVVSTTQKIMLFNPVNTYYAANTSHIFSFVQIKNPPSTKPTETFYINIYTSSGNLMFSYKKPIYYTATPGTFSSINITQTNQEIFQITNYLFTLSPGNEILSKSYIKITFPQEVSPQSLSSFTCPITANNVNIDATCEILNSQNKNILYIKNAFPSGLSTNSSIKIPLSNIKNYNCAQKSSSFIIETFTDENYKIDSKESNIFVDFIEGGLKNISITPSSLIANDINNYSFIFKLKNVLQNNSIFSIGFPSDIIVNSGLNTNNLNCELFINNVPQSGFTCVLLNQTVTIGNFNNNNPLQADTIINLNFINIIKNKRNLLDSGLFSINTSSSTNCKIDKNYENLKIKNSFIPNIKKITITPESKVNGIITNYDIKIYPTGKIIATDKIKFSIPSQIKSSSGNVLLILSNSNIKTQIADKVGNFYIINIETDVVDFLNFKILSLKNNFSTKNLETFEFSITDSSGADLEKYDNSIQEKLQIAQIENNLTIPAIQANNSTSLNFSFSTANVIPLDGLIYIKTYPGQIKDTVNAKCEDLSSTNPIPDLVCVFSDPNFIIKNKFGTNPASEGDNIKLKISNLNFITNSNNSYNFDISTFEKGENNILYPIDLASHLQITFGCNSYCSKCLANGNTCILCSSSLYILKDGLCISNCPETSPFLYEDETGNKICRSDCPVNYFPDINKKCIKCESPCLECISKTECKNCLDGFLFYSQNSSCSTKCPGNTIQKVKNCIECDSSCLTCSNLDYKKCQSCKKDKIFYNEMCINPEDCPSGTVAVNGRCILCDPKCERCIEKPEKCIKCFSPYSIDQQNNTCFMQLSQCSTGYYLDNYKKCSLCQVNCEDCDGEFTCKKCTPGFALEISQCVKNCSAGFFFNKDSISCERCGSNCKTCDLKYDNCTTCNELSFLYNFGCVYSCPEGFYKDNLTKGCLKCDSTCENCGQVEENYLINSINLNNLKCDKCVKGLYLIDGVCMSRCPNNFMSEESTRRCISSRLFSQIKFVFLEKKKIIKIPFFNFYFLISVLIIILFFFLVKKCDRRIFYFGICTGFISLVDLAVHLNLTYFYFINSYTFFFMISGCALCLRIILNNIFIFGYKILAFKDIEHKYWITYNFCTDKLYHFLIFVDYKLIRITYSRFLKTFKIEFFDNKYRDYSKVNKIYKFFRIFDFILVDSLIFLNCSLFLYFTTKFSVLWFNTAEFGIIRVILLIFSTIDLMANKNINEDFFYQGKSRIDVAPNLYNKNSRTPVKEKYNIEIDDYLSYDSNNQKKTDCTRKRSNTEDNFCVFYSKNYFLRDFYYLESKDINPFIPRDDCYLNIFSEKKKKFYEKVFYKDEKNSDNFINFSYVENPIGKVPYSLGKMINEKNANFLFEKNIREFNNKKKNENVDFETCPNFEIFENFTNIKKTIAKKNLENIKLFSKQKQKYSKYEDLIAFANQGMNNEENSDIQKLKKNENDNVKINGKSYFNRKSLIFNKNSRLEKNNVNEVSYLNYSDRSNNNLMKKNYNEC